MKKILFGILLVFLLAACDRPGEEDLNYFNRENGIKLWYQQPAKTWDEALPVGNGRLGAMVFGGVYRERIQVNEESLWAGKRFNTNNPDALNDLPRVREFIFQEEIKEAYELGNKSLLGTPPRFRSYQTLGDIYLSFDSIASFTDYKRELHLNPGISRTVFIIDEITYTREVFASAPDNIIVIHITADKPGAISTSIALQRQKDANVKAEFNQLILTGQIIDETTDAQGPGGKHIKFAAILLALNKGGELSADSSMLLVKNADELSILFTAATDYKLDKLNFDRDINPLKICNEILNKAENKSIEEIKEAHIKEHQSVFNRVEINLGKTQLAGLPTDKRLDSVVNGGNDPGLVALYFQYGRYLLMGSSRAPGILPANLQGIWNEHLKAPWNSDYHTNINLQMNYWHAEICKLPETLDPLINIVDKWREPGRITAKDMYGCNGWCMHHATDIFGKTVPNADMRWGMSPLSGVWMCFPLWRHYEFTLDKHYLENRAYPIMKEAMDFVSDFLIEKDGYLVTNPTMSPENSYTLDGKDYPCQLTYAATIDNQTLMAHINHCIQASEILDVDEDLRDEWIDILLKIPPVRIGKDSTIMEWIKDYDEWEPGHRHMSHLLGLYPLAQITPETPELFEAAKRTIAKRLQYGGGHTGWSRAWMINFFARLHEPEAAYDHVMALLRKSTQSNLFDSHPPFQIDGNFGGTAGIAEMLLQSHNGVIQILPALPAAWPDGSIKGLRARGGFEVDIEWEDGVMTTSTIYANTDNSCFVKYKDHVESIELKKGESIPLIMSGLR
ncbi:MAG: glycoside hydrolase N-terminal domain-containing protein [Bacteroidota bacterium]|nr:glycoside hydrolase N-terminal domain-containing protein [Bacteroidota bacterium]